MTDWYDPNQWSPTPQLRFVQKLQFLDANTAKKVQILQQLWQRIDHETCISGEIIGIWRDVPVVEESHE